MLLPKEDLKETVQIWFTELELRSSL